MISISKADQVISKSIKEYKAVLSSLTESYGAILQEDIKADRDLPSFNKSLMDGIAINTNGLSQTSREFTIIGTQPAGRPALKVKKNNQCVEIMTGGVVPASCNCVIPIEQVKISGNKAIVDKQVAPQKMQFIREQGADHKKGKVLIQKGARLQPPQIATAASVGKAKVKISVIPKVAIISTGDEIVEIDAPIKPYQIRKSNSYFIQSALQRTFLLKPTIFHLPDNKRALLTQISAILKEYDVLILTGGVSMGKFDFVPQVLKTLGVKVMFHKVKQKPGRPFWFGKSKNGKPVFALPGNPVSTQIGTYRHVIPQLKKALGVSVYQEHAALTQDYKLDTDFTFFLPVKLRTNSKGHLKATPIKTGGSGDFATIGQSDGFMEIPANKKKVKAGFIGEVYRW